MQKEKIHKTFTEMNIYDGFDYEVMVAFCCTLYNLGLHEGDLDILDWEHIEPGRHFVSACIKFWRPDELGFAGPTIRRVIPTRR